MLSATLVAYWIGAERPGVLRRPFRRGQDHGGRPVRHLTAIGLAHPALDDRIGLIVGGEAGVGEGVVARLGVRVALGVVEIDLGDAAQVRLIDAVALVVLVGQVGEGARPDIGGVAELMAGPGRRAQIFGARLAGDIAHQFDAQHQGRAVMAGLNVRHGRQQGQTARGAGALVPRRRQVAEAGLGLGEEAAQQALTGEQVADEVADMADVDVLGIQTRGLQPAVHGLAEAVEHLLALARPVAPEVRLPAAQNIGHGSSPQAALRSGRVASCASRIVGPCDQVAWVPLDIRPGIMMRATGPSPGFCAS